MWIYWISFTILVGLLLKAVAVWDTKTKVRNMETMVKHCATTSQNAMHVVLYGSNKENISETLFTLLQHAQCPRNLRIILFEVIEAYEEESTSIKLYISKCENRGLYVNDFRDIITIYHISNTTRCIFTSIQQQLVAQQLRPLVLLCNETARFVKHWDASIVQDFQSLPQGMLLCSASNQNQQLYSNYTVIDSFLPLHESAQVLMPHIAHRPLHRKGPNIRTLWASLPLVVDNVQFFRLQGCSVLDALLQASDDKESAIWTSRNPIALLEGTCMEDKYTEPYQANVSKLRLLGVYEKSNYLEIIAKFGSLAAFQWAIAN